MSRVVRRKHVLKEMMEDSFVIPTGQQKIVQVISSRGNNLHEVKPPEPDMQSYLASMPNKFRKNVWVKRGDFVLVEPIEEGDKVKAEICKILTAEYIREYTKAGVWPKQFTKKRLCWDDELLEHPLRNPNRPFLKDPKDSSSSGDNNESSSD